MGWIRILFIEIKIHDGEWRHRGPACKEHIFSDQSLAPVAPGQNGANANQVAFAANITSDANARGCHAGKVSNEKLLAAHDRLP